MIVPPVGFFSGSSPSLRFNPLETVGLVTIFALLAIAASVSSEAREEIIKFLDERERKRKEYEALPWWRRMFTSKP